MSSVIEGGGSDTLALGLQSSTPVSKVKSKASDPIKSSQNQPLSVMLGTATSGGSMAAVRQLAAQNYQVDVITSSPLSAAAWSRGNVRSYSAPAEGETDRFLKRLLELGACGPKRVLLSTSDETAWLYTLKREALEPYYYVHQPSLETMRRMLEKKLFAEAVDNAGLPALQTWEPKSLDHLRELAPAMTYPVLIKPRTHVRRMENGKGSVAHTKEELIREYSHFVEQEKYRGGSAHVSDCSLPLVQQFVDVTNDGVCSVSGYIDKSGELFVTRRSKKVFQRSQPVGVGVCFESLPSDPEMSNSARRLCRELGYFGIFEVEFLRCDKGWAPIDFNGRLFNQIGLDIRRKMPLPHFACLEAVGDLDGLRDAIQKSQLEDSDHKSVFCDQFTLRAILLARTLTARISPEQRTYWKNWLRNNAPHTVDAALDSSDKMPAVIHALSEVYLGVKAFPRFLRSSPRASVVSYVTERAH